MSDISDAASGPLRLRSHAKINLHLQVIGRRPDGYHELRTVFQTIDLADEVSLELRQRPGVELVVRGADLPSDERNLAFRAAQRLLDAVAPQRGVRIELEKRIPHGGGLGGGSSNAACVLRGLDRLLGGPTPPALLWQLARGLGADVPYFLLGGTALGVGRGDELMPLPEPGPRELVVVLPPVGVSTPEVFARLPPASGAALAATVQAVAAGWCAPDRLWSADDLVNDLEEVACALAPEVALGLAVLRAAGATVARMSGSGSTVFGLLTGAVTRSGSLDLPAGFRQLPCRTVARSELG